MSSFDLLLWVKKGDSVYCIDLRVTSPNKEYLSTTELHSMEHFLLAGFRKYLPDNFIIHWDHGLSDRFLPGFAEQRRCPGDLQCL